MDCVSYCVSVNINLNKISSVEENKFFEILDKMNLDYTVYKKFEKHNSNK